MYKKSIASLVVVILLVLSLHLLLRGGLFSEQLTRFAESRIQRLTGTPVTVHRVTLSLLPAAVVLDGVVLPAPEAGRPPIAIQRIRAWVSPWSLLTQVTFIKKIRLIGPEIVLRIGHDSVLPIHPNLANGSPASPGGPSKNLTLVIRQIEIQNGRLELQRPSGEPFLRLSQLEGTVNPDLLMENFQVTLSAKGVAVDSNDFHKKLDSMTAQLNIRSNELEIKTLELTDSTSHYTVSGSIQNPTQPRLALSVDAAFPLDDLNPLLPGRFPMSGAARFTGHLVGPGSDPMVRGNLSISNGFVSSKSVGSLKTVFLYQDHAFSFSDLSADVFGGKISGEVRVSMTEISKPGGPIPYGLSLQFNGLDPSGLLPILGFEAYPSSQRLEGAVDLKGRIKEMRINPKDLSGKGRVHLVNKEGGPADLPSGKPSAGSKAGLIGLLARLREASTGFQIDSGILSLDKTIARTDRSSLTVQGQIQTDGPIALEATLESRDMGELTSLAASPLIEGGLKLAGRVTGTLKDPVFKGDGRMHNVQLRGRHFDAVESDLLYQNRTIRFKQAILQEKQARYEIKGLVSFDPSADGRPGPFFDLAAKIRHGAPREVVALFTKELPIDVPATGDLTVKGVPSQFRLEAHLQAGSGSLYGQSIDEGTVTLVLTRDRIVFKEARAQKGETELTGRGSIGFNGEFEFSAETSRARLEDFEPEMKNLAVFRGPLTGRISGSGPFQNPRFETQLSFLDVVYQNQSLGPGSLTAEIKNHRLTADFQLTRGVRGSGEMDWAPGHPYRIALSLDNVDLKPWFGSAVPNLTAVNRFTASGTLTASGQIDPPGGAGLEALNTADAAIHLTSLGVDVTDYVVTNDGDIQLEVHQGNVSIQSLKLKGPGTTLAVSGDLRLFKSYNFFINGEADLDLFRIFMKEITYAKGLAYLALQITDRWEDPKIRGGLTIHDGVVKSASLGQTLAITSVNFSFNERQVLLETFDAEFGGGRLQAAGRIDLVRFVPAHYALNLEMVGSRINPLKGFTALVDASLFFQSDTKVQSLSGEVEIRRAEYERRLDWQTWVLALAKPDNKESTPLPWWLKDTTLNIQIQGRNNIWIKNNLAKLPLDVDLLLKGTVNRPILLGRVEAKGGSFSFRHNDFKIVSGTVDFVNPERIRPVVDVRATTRVTTYDIDLSLVGPADKFDLTLSSNPPLTDQNDILCLLTFRRLCKEVETSTKGIGTTEASALAAQAAIENIITDEVESFTGIDRIEVDPYYSSNKAGSVPMVSVSKQLLDNKLYVTYAITMDPSQEQIIQLEYTINKNVSLLGQRDELGHMGGDLKLHFEFR
ncbi:MAG: translocation/assembly module TamB domain-containing protein [Nitrospirae bacterium]|nr:translocation/assembly module TamB domain-containing protein [Nitrospirota bacterium]